IRSACSNLLGLALASIGWLPSVERLAVPFPLASPLSSRWSACGLSNFTGGFFSALGAGLGLGGAACLGGVGGGSAVWGIAFSRIRTLSKAASLGGGVCNTSHHAKADNPRPCAISDMHSAGMKLLSRRLIKHAPLPILF